MHSDIEALKALIGEVSLEEDHRARLLIGLKRIEKAAAKLEFSLDRARKEKEVQFKLLSKTTDDLRLALVEMEERVRERTRSLERRTIQLATAAEVGSSIAALRDPKELLQFVVQVIAVRFNYYHVNIFLVSETGTELLIAAATGQSSHEMLTQGMRLRVGRQGIVAWVAANHAPRVVANVRAEPLYLDTPLLPETRSEIALPLMSGQTVLGVLDVQANVEDAFDDSDVQALQSMANHIATALENARLYRQSLDYAEQMVSAREAADAANRAKSSFLANMSHEIRTPMNAVIGMTSLLLGTGLTAEQQDFAETIRDSGEALLTIIDDILDFSKIEAGKLELEQQPFELRTCVESALELFSVRAAEKGLEVACLLEPNLPETIAGDALRLRQILVNLLSNAIRFTDRGEVVVSAEATPLDHPAAGRYEIHFAVRDTGIGIPPEGLTRLFQSFSQVDASTTRKYGGTGLGLAISKLLSEMMGGTMWVESQVGQGTTFHFTLQAQATAALSGAAPAAQTELQGKRLLIVDDNATNRRILIQQAESWGMVPWATASGGKALALIREGKRFDLALLDMQMPVMDGVALARAIRREPAAATLPLVLLTSLGRHPSEVKMGAPFAAYLSKPIRASALYDTLVIVCAGQAAAAPEASEALHFDSTLAERYPLRILLAEDHPVNQKLILALLARMGYRAEVANNGLEVLAALQRHEYDVVLMDVQMPEMDGLEAARRICRQWAPAKRPRIVAVTANTMRGDCDDCLAAGMDDYLGKPLKVEELQQALVRSGEWMQERTGRTVGAAAGAELGRYSDDRLASGAADAVDPSSPPVAEPEVLDPTALATLRELQIGGEPDLLCSLIELYLAETPPLLSTMREGLRAGDVEPVREAAHTLKSTSGSLGAGRMAALCVQLEGCLRRGSLGESEALVAGLVQDYGRVEQALKRMQHDAKEEW
jgi:signal transduction histidine kinase/CheY-like chemotaxis protein/HPt (histidine-containing phosphotransfer) domain-containing protein